MSSPSQSSPSQSSVVKFATQNDTRIIPRLKQYKDSEFRELEPINRKYRTIEKFMRKHHLLFPYEYVAFENHKQKHIRSDFIEFILRQLKIITLNQYVQIIS